MTNDEIKTSAILLGIILMVSFIFFRSSLLDGTFWRDILSNIAAWIIAILIVLIGIKVLKKYI